MIEIKLCGLKEPSHIKVAFNLGIEYIGLVLYKKSPRYLNGETARSLISNSPPGIKKVGLVVDPTNDFLDAISNPGSVRYWFKFIESLNLWVPLKVIIDTPLGGFVLKAKSVSD